MCYNIILLISIGEGKTLKIVNEDKVSLAKWPKVVDNISPLQRELTTTFEFPWKLNVWFWFLEWREQLF